jgi:hypothetical protein
VAVKRERSAYRRWVSSAREGSSLDIRAHVPVFADRSWFDGNYFAVLEDIDRRAVHSSYLTRATRGTPECASDRLGEIVALPILSWLCGCHGLFSSNRGVSPELS